MNNVALWGLIVLGVLIFGAILFGFKDKSSDKPGTGVPEDPQGPFKEPKNPRNPLP